MQRAIAIILISFDFTLILIYLSISSLFSLVLSFSFLSFFFLFNSFSSFFFLCIIPSSFVWKFELESGMSATAIGAIFGKWRIIPLPSARFRCYFIIAIGVYSTAATTKHIAYSKQQIGITCSNVSRKQCQLGLLILLTVVIHLCALGRVFTSSTIH